MAAPTVTKISDNLAANGGPTSGGDFKIEFFKVVPASATDQDLTCTGVTLSHVFGMLECAMDTTDTAAANSEKLWIDEALDSTKNCIVVSGGSVTVKRALADTGGALISKVYVIGLVGY